VLRAWLRETTDQPGSPLFPSRDGGTLTRDAIERRLAQHVKTAQQACVSLRSKRVTMHTLRHTAAMNLLTAGVDTSTIALWLGHEQERTTHLYLQPTSNSATHPGPDHASRGPPGPLPSPRHSARLPREPIARPRYHSATESERATGSQRDTLAFRPEQASQPTERRRSSRAKMA
jgi:hypothetical protein